MNKYIAIIETDKQTLYVYKVEKDSSIIYLDSEEDLKNYMEESELSFSSLNTYIHEHKIAPI